MTQGIGFKPDFKLDVSQIAGLIDFMNQHPKNEEDKDLTNWQYCLKLFNKENAGSKVQVDENIQMPNYRLLVEHIVENEVCGYYLGIYETVMADLESMLLKKLEKYKAGLDNPHLYDDDIINLIHEEKTVEDFLPKEREFLEGTFIFDNEEELKEEVRGLLASKWCEITTRQEGVKDIIRRVLRRQINYLLK